MTRWTFPLWLLVVGVAPASARAQQAPPSGEETGSTQGEQGGEGQAGVPEETQRELEALRARIALLEAEQESTQTATSDAQSQIAQLQQDLTSLQERAAAINDSRVRRLSALSEAAYALRRALEVLGTGSGEINDALEVADVSLSAAANEAVRFGSGGEAAMIDQALANVRSAGSALTQHDFENPYEYLVIAIYQTQQAHVLAQAQPPQTAVPSPSSP